MRRDCIDRFIDVTIAGIAVLGWCVIAPTTVIGCELFDLAERLGVEWRSLRASLGGVVS